MWSDRYNIIEHVQGLCADRRACARSVCWSILESSLRSHRLGNVAGCSQDMAPTFSNKTLNTSLEVKFKCKFVVRTGSKHKIVLLILNWKLVRDSRCLGPSLGLSYANSLGYGSSSIPGARSMKRQQQRPVRNYSVIGLVSLFPSRVPAITCPGPWHRPVDPPAFCRLNMDTDSNDGSAADVVDGESKPDLYKLAQTAIIKQVSGPLPPLHLALCQVHNTILCR